MADKLNLKQLLVDLGNRNTSTEADERLIQALLDVLGITGKVTGGIVYVFPYDKQPTDIHTFAKVFAEKLFPEKI